MSFKRIIALVLSLLMVFGSAAAVFAAEAEETAAAATEEVASPYAAAVKSLMQIGAKNGKNGIFKGLENGDLDLDSDVSRWQMALFVSRILTGETDDSYWGKVTVSSSIFTDIDEGSTASNYLGAIGYASQKGVIVGWKDASSGKDVFGPENGIKYQDALTMCTRALGFAGLAYPWGNIEKAIDLGLTAGIIDVGYEDELTRGEVAQILYNTLIAYTVDAKTGERTNLLKSVFGTIETTVVIVASEDVIYDATNKELDRDNYVSFSELDLKTGRPAVDGNGKVIVYNLAKSNFGIEGNTNLSVGDSYFVTTYDNFQTLVICEKLNEETFWNIGATQVEFKMDTFNTEKFAEDLGLRPYDKVVIVNAKDEKDLSNNYRIVKDYTYLNNTQGSVSGLEPIPGDFELLAYDPSQAQIKYDVDRKYYQDNFGHIYAYSKDGLGFVTFDVKYYFNPFTSTYAKVAVHTNPDGTKVNVFTPVTMADIEADASVILSKTTLLSTDEFKQLGSLTRYAYASLKLLDDGGAPDFDRAIYKSYGLMKYEEYTDDGARVALRFNGKNWDSNDGKIENGLNQSYFSGVSAADFAKNYTIVNAEDYKEMKFDLEKDRDGKNVKFFIGYYNWQTRTIEVLRTLEVKQGIVKGWNGPQKSITINNEVYPANYTNFKHSAVLFNEDAISIANALKIHEWYNRNVRYIVVDGQVVYIEDDTRPELGVIVLDEFIGYTADGKGEFYAYTAFEPGARRRIQVSTINGWYGNFQNQYGYTQTFINLIHESMDARRDSNGVYYLAYEAVRGEASLKFGMYGNGVFDTPAPVTAPIKVMTNVGAEGPQNVQVINATVNTYFVFVVDNGQGTSTIYTSKGIPSMGASIYGEFTYVNPAMVIVHVENFKRDVVGFNTSEQVSFVFVTNDWQAPVGTTGTNAANLPYVSYEKLYDIKTADGASYQTANQFLQKNKIYKVVDGIISATYVNADMYIFQETIGYWYSEYAQYGIGGTSTFANGFDGNNTRTGYNYPGEDTLWATRSNISADNKARRESFVLEAKKKIYADLVAINPAMFSGFTYFNIAHGDVPVKDARTGNNYNNDYNFLADGITARDYTFAYVYDIKTQKLVIYITGFYTAPVAPVNPGTSIVSIPAATNTVAGTGMYLTGTATVSYTYTGKAMTTADKSITFVANIKDADSVYTYTAADKAYGESINGTGWARESTWWDETEKDFKSATTELGSMRASVATALALYTVDAFGVINGTPLSTVTVSAEDANVGEYSGVKFTFTSALPLPAGNYVVMARTGAGTNRPFHLTRPNEFYYFTVVAE